MKVLISRLLSRLGCLLVSFVSKGSGVNKKWQWIIVFLSSQARGTLESFESCSCRNEGVRKRIFLMSKNKQHLMVFWKPWHWSCLQFLDDGNIKRRLNQVQLGALLKAISYWNKSKWYFRQSFLFHRRSDHKESWFRWPRLTNDLLHQKASQMHIHTKALVAHLLCLCSLRWEGDVAIWNSHRWGRGAWIVVQ